MSGSRRRSLYLWGGAVTLTSMAVELPVLSGDPVCPMAFPIRGTCRAEAGVVCRLMQEDAEQDEGLRMTPRALEVVRDSDGGVYLNVKTDPSSVTAFCHGRALPKMHDGEAARAHHTFCPVYEAWWERSHAGEDGLYDETEPESVACGIEGMDSMGMSTLDEPDPWGAVRRDLKMFETEAAA